MSTSRLLAALVVLAAGACTKANSLYCEQADECASGYRCDLLARECVFDGRDGGDGTGCTSSATCPDTTPICNADRECVACAGASECADRNPDEPLCNSDGACVECIANADCTDPTADFCDTATGVCRGCLDNDECSSEVCNRDLGSCADVSTIIYVDNDGGADSATCGGQSTPCETLVGTDGALAKVGPGRRTIRVRPGAGGYVGAITLDAIAVVIVGGGASISPIVADRSAITVSGGANVTIDGLTVAGASGTGHGISCSGDGSIVRLTGAVVSGNAGVGVEVVAPCDLRVARSIIRNNGGGGIHTTGDQFDIANSMIVDNGDASALYGGVVLSGTGTSATRRFELNTVAGNTRTSGAGGIACGAALTIGSSIVWGNSGSQASPMCSFTYSDVAGGATGDGNLDVDPLFATSEDYHLQATSPCIDAGDPSATLGIDVDGENRPIGGRSDIGADETGGGS